ncbi:MAG: BrnA antitoxin family protein [Zoogloeaceae bacterium]|jgi:uncharacterized protein (DUF4415 family)|nr:BrnA antitoxin family protein [Zoogloeaceae bacterium]
MRKEYDFSNAKRAHEVPHLARLQEELKKGKTRITIWLDDDVLESFRARAAEEGRGYQTIINETLKSAALSVSKADDAAPVTLKAIRRVLREKLRAA